MIISSGASSSGRVVAAGLPPLQARGGKGGAPAGAEADAGGKAAGQPRGVKEGLSAVQKGGAGAAGSDSAEAQAEIQQVVKELAARDTQVRSHEAAHIAAGGNLVRGGATFTYEKGPDGRQYAVGGEVSIDTSPVAGDPQATIAKMAQVRAAALAPADPSATDYAVAASAAQAEASARAELTRELAGGGEEESGGDAAAGGLLAKAAAKYSRDRGPTGSQFEVRA